MHEISEYRGNKIITLRRSEEDKYPFTFGVGKAKLILDNLDAIKRFYEENKKG